MALRWLTVVWLMTGCSRPSEFRANLTQAVGLKPGAPVWVAGMEVGTVVRLRLADDVAEVTFEVRPPNTLRPHQDACAMGLVKGVLVMSGKTGTLAAGAPIPQCEVLTAEEVRRGLVGAGGAAGEALHEFLVGAGLEPAPGAEPATGQLRPPHCDQVSVRVVSTQLVRDLLSAEGRVLVGLQFTNRGPEHLEVGAADEALFLGQERRSLTRVSAPGEDAWFLPFVVPARGSTTKVISFVRGAPLEALEFSVRPTSRPLDGCLVRQSGLDVPDAGHE